jgi:hypothetical protein
MHACMHGYSNIFTSRSQLFHLGKLFRVCCIGVQLKRPIQTGRDLIFFNVFQIFGTTLINFSYLVCISCKIFIR